MKCSPLSVTLVASLSLSAACGGAESPPAAGPEATPAVAEPPAPSPAAGASVTGAASAFDWPVAAGWRAETIPFPLGFAPSLPYRGVEELRFGPDFFEPTSSHYFTYAFVWVVEDRPAFDEATLERDLVKYFAGLADAVNRGRFTLDPAHHRADLREIAAGQLGGTVETYDAFKTGKALTLFTEVAVRDCGERRVVLAAASPRPRPEAVWQDLDEVTRSFACK